MARKTAVERARLASLAIDPWAVAVEHNLEIEASALSSDGRVLSMTTFRRIAPLTPVSPFCCEPLASADRNLRRAPRSVVDAHRLVQRGMEVVRGVQLFHRHDAEVAALRATAIDDGVIHANRGLHAERAAFFPSKAAELEAVYASIARELVSQYALGYVASTPGNRGAFKRVSVRLLPPAEGRARTRSGYLARTSTAAAPSGLSSSTFGQPH
jgi:hypothetical protein